MSRQVNKERRSALLGTILFHAAAILILFLMALKTPLPLPEEEGVEVDLGMMDQGMGNIQPENVAAMPQSAPAPEPVSEDNRVKTKEDIVTQDTEEAPALKQEKKKTEKPKEPAEKPVQKPVEKPKEEPKPTVNERALFKGSSNPGQEGGSEGITGQPGDQGNPQGMAGVKRYDGEGGKGNGTHYSLGGRGAKSLKKPSNDFTEQGTIVVNIWVNPKGKVIRTDIAAKGTTIIDSGMRAMAREAALQSVFDADPSAPDEQKGTITYTFVFNQNN